MNAVHQPKRVQPEDRELWNLESLEAVEYSHVRTAEEERQLEMELEKELAEIYKHTSKEISAADS